VVRKLFASEYEKTFLEKPNDDEAVMVNVGKVLAAFQETLVTGRTPFDDFRDGLEKEDSAEIQKYPAAAQRGLRIFIGKGNCAVCHFGPTFTNGEFADTGIGFFVEKGRVDSGRLGGIKKLLDDRFNLLSKYNDDPSRATPELQARDPENRLLARGPRFRLDGEVVRDQALFVSGLLRDAIGWRTAWVVFAVLALAAGAGLLRQRFQERDQVVRL